MIIGKQASCFGLTVLLIKLGLARTPHAANYLRLYGIACLARVGFTTSLFIGMLSFGDLEMTNQMRVGVMAGSVVSGSLGCAALMLASVPGTAMADVAPAK